MSYQLVLAQVQPLIAAQLDEEHLRARVLQIRRPRVPGPDRRLEEEPAVTGLLRPVWVPVEADAHEVGAAVHRDTVLVRAREGVHGAAPEAARKLLARDGDGALVFGEGDGEGFEGVLGDEVEEVFVLE